MNNTLYDLLYRIATLTTRIADYFNNKFEAEYYRREAIVEEEYNKLVTDFYENGAGYYGRE